MQLAMVVIIVRNVRSGGSDDLTYATATYHTQHFTGGESLAIPLALLYMTMHGR